MNVLSRLVDRALPALLMASSVVLLSAGLFAYAPVAPATDRSGAATDDLGRPAASPTPLATRAAAPPPTSHLPAPTSTASLPPSSSPPPGSLPLPSATNTPITTLPANAATATRIVVPSLGIDLPIVAGDLDVRGNRDNFPLCDVAQYLIGYSQPGQPGTTYLYAHARRGMFLPLLEESQRNDGRGMIGAVVEVYTADDRLHLYEIHIVKRHAVDLTLAHELPPAGHQLVMQTSEGPRGTIPKLQVAARPLSVVDAEPADARRSPRPRPCG